MKKVLLTIVMILAFAFSAFAQDDVFAPGLTNAGIKAGVAMAKFSGDDIDAAEEAFGVDASYLLGFAVGGFVEYGFSPSFSVQPELLYHMKGVKFEEDPVTMETKLSYIQLPVLLKFNIPMEGNIHPYLFAGPAVSFLMSADETLEGTDEDDYDEDVKDYFKDIDFGAVVGVGAAFNVGAKGALTFDARFDMGLSNVGEDIEIEGVTFESDVKTQSIAFMLGYSFL